MCSHFAYIFRSSYKFVWQKFFNLPHNFASCLDNIQFVALYFIVNIASLYLDYINLQSGTMSKGPAQGHFTFWKLVTSKKWRQYAVKCQISSKFYCHQKNYRPTGGIFLASAECCSNWLQRWGPSGPVLRFFGEKKFQLGGGIVTQQQQQQYSQHV